MRAEPVLELRGVVKRFGERNVLDGLDLSLGEGDVLGFLGRNGAGKTTTLRIVMGLARAQAGTVRVFGADAWALPAPLKQRVGFLAESQEAFSWMRVQELLDFTAGLYPCWDAGCERDLVRKLELSRRAGMWELSAGEKRRVGLVIALAPRPDLLVLDEPAAGLDAVARRDFLNVVLDLIAQEGKTAIFSSHVLADVERVASRIGILHGGRLRFDGPIEALQDGVRAIDVELPPGRSLRLEDVPGAIAIEPRGTGRWTVVASGFEPGVLEVLMARLPGGRFDAREVGLEEIFLAYVGAGRA